MSYRSLLVVTGGAVFALAACSSPSSAKKVAPSAAKPAAARAAAASAAKTPAAPAANASPAAKTPDTDPDAPAYSYQSAGRRDPFLALVSNEPAKPAAALGLKPAQIKRGDGVAGLLIAEMVVRGIAQTSNKLVALVQGPDGRNYNVHESDKLADGTVKTVTEDGLVITQVINDPAATVKHREVRKLLRSLEGAKP